jgi:hypothetical protein
MMTYFMRYESARFRRLSSSPKLYCITVASGVPAP